MNSRATQQYNMFPYVYAVYWLPTASSAFLLARKCNWLVAIMLITCVMRHARTDNIQLSGPTVHSLYCDHVVWTSRTPNCVVTNSLNKLNWFDSNALSWKHAQLNCFRLSIIVVNYLLCFQDWLYNCALYWSIMQIVKRRTACSGKLIS